MPTTILTPPSALPVSLAEAKAYCRVESDHEDALIADLIEAATAHVEQATCRALVERELMLTMRCFPLDLFRLPWSPVLSVASVKYRDLDGVLHTLTADVDYLADLAAQPATVEPVRDWPATGPYPDAVQVTYTAGHDGSPLDIPQRARVAILALVAQWYDRRTPEGPPGSVAEVPYSVTRLINGLRVWGG